MGGADGAQQPSSNTPVVPCCAVHTANSPAVRNRAHPAGSGMRISGNGSRNSQLASNNSSNPGSASTPKESAGRHATQRPPGTGHSSTDLAAECNRGGGPSADHTPSTT